MSSILPITPRVNSAMLSQYVGQPVRFVGKIIEQNGTRAVMAASDKGQVHVHMTELSQYGTQYVEVIGTVNGDFSISEMASTNFGNDFDLDTYNETVKKMQQFPSVF
ncbi:hypothetical protein BGX28_002369 [Mortierella sp. GBA30]|nr:hypothetical protein BGX28_002369 [Mortierella sp. GBA30]